ncbi:DUF1015 domain-containing protein [Candidatus Magnetomonas plexicatena]|uniref:DUF1015 domain-containing protein n=1 Tax=Candidatus Magnetomonas plexicatena TaxID=2552947 RepID=UPI0011014109|nr:DUF1015 domain-containing protein [Nitrospirales bacterium LBB_01]
MTGAAPFKGLMYDPQRVSLSDVTAPPYDIITPEMQANLHSKSPYNIVRVDWAMERPGDNDKENKYVRAAKTLNEWIDNGTMKFKDKPAFFLYEVLYECNGSVNKMRGIFAAVKLVKPGCGVYPHEMTHSKPKQDRLNLMRSSGANTSPIFSLYNSNNDTLIGVLDAYNSTAPYFEYTDSDKTFHRCWIIDNSADVAKITDALEGESFFIADGHHRYETALEYQRLMRAENGADTPQGYDYVLMLITNIRDGGISILPTHRMVNGITADNLERLKEYFDVQHIGQNADITAHIRSKTLSFGLYLGGSFYTLTYRGVRPDGVNGIDVMVLHDIVFGRLYNISEFGYEMSVEKTVESVRGGKFDAAIFLNPTRVEDVELSAKQGVRMPPKSTYFYPKIPTGIVINNLGGR